MDTNTDGNNKKPKIENVNADEVVSINVGGELFFAKKSVFFQSPYLREYIASNSTHIIDRDPYDFRLFLKMLRDPDYITNENSRKIMPEMKFFKFYFLHQDEEKNKTNVVIKLCDQVSSRALGPQVTYSQDLCLLHVSQIHRTHAGSNVTEKVWLDLSIKIPTGIIAVIVPDSYYQNLGIENKILKPGNHCTIGFKIHKPSKSSELTNFEAPLYGHPEFFGEILFLKQELAKIDFKNAKARRIGATYS